MKILVTPRSFGKTNPELFEQLEGLGFTIVRNDTGAILSEEAICEKIADCDAVILGVDPCGRKVLEHARNLKAIARYGVGLDNVDLKTCEERGIKVSRTVGANSNAVADFAFALMLGVARKVPLIDRRCRAGDWGKNTGIDVFGKRIGIIGLGAVGKCMARRALGFDMKILATDPVFDEEFVSHYGISKSNIDEICSSCDFITLHTVLNDKTRNIINRQRIGMMKTNTVLINTARGGLIDEAALLNALKKKAIYGAGIDVFASEPPAEKDWFNLDNIILSSHTSSSTEGTTKLMGEMCVSAIREAFSH